MLDVVCECVSVSFILIIMKEHANFQPLFHQIKQEFERYLINMSTSNKLQANKQFQQDDSEEQGLEDNEEDADFQDVSEPAQVVSSSQSSISSNSKMKQQFDCLGDLIAKLNEDDHSEDEGIEDYNVGGYHPCHIGEILINRYVLIQKLGWGHFSTVWLAKDFKYSSYVAIKVMKSAPHYLEASYDEIQILQKVAKNALNSEWLKTLRQYEKGKTKFDRDDCHVLNLLNAFLYKGPYGNHFCMVFQILGINLWQILKKYDCKGLPVNVVKEITRQVLMGLDFLNRICRVIHTDLKPENVLVCLTEKELKRIVEDEQLASQSDFTNRLNYYCQKFGLGPRSASVDGSSDLSEDSEDQQLGDEAGLAMYNQKIADLNEKINSEGVSKNCRKTLKKKIRKLQDDRDKQLQAISNGNNKFKNKGESKEQKTTKAKIKRTVHELFGNHKRKISFDNVEGGLQEGFKVKIADLGNACWEHHHFATQIQTRQYRSPEVLLGSNYNLSADMWSFACMTFQLLTGELLFNPKKDPNDQFGKNDDHLAQIMELMGRFPKKMSMRGEKAKRYIDKAGSLARIPKLQNWTLKDVMVAKYRFNDQQAQFFQDFMAPMLNCYPERRTTAQQLLSHKWLYKPCPESYLLDHLTHEKIRIERYDVNEEKDEFYQYESQNEDGQVEDNDSGEQEDLYENTKQGDIRLIDRSFTDLGYIGYGTGIYLQKLDFGPNWQFS